MSHPILSHTAFRLVKKKLAGQAFDGEGARLYGGRWNSKGRPCVYLSSSVSLAALEIMVHLDNYALLQSYALFQINIPDSLSMQLSPQMLPNNWNDNLAPASTADMGNEWLDNQSSLALFVPSVIVPMEKNIILNPLHPEFRQVSASIKELDFSPDPRLFNQ